jgi:hypothetical protein
MKQEAGNMEKRVYIPQGSLARFVAALESRRGVTLAPNKESRHAHS